MSLFSRRENWAENVVEPRQDGRPGISSIPTIKTREGSYSGIILLVWKRNWLEKKIIRKHDVMKKGMHLLYLVIIIYESS